MPGPIPKDIDASVIFLSKPWTTVDAVLKKEEKEVKEVKALIDDF